MDFSFNGVLDSSSSIAGLSPSYVGNLHEVGSCLTVDGNFRPKDAFVVAKCNNGDIDCHGSLLSLSDINNISGNMTIGQHEEFFSFGYNPRYIASPPSSSPEINFCSADNIPVVGNHTDLCSVNGSVGDIIADTDYTNWNVLYGSKTNIVDPSINDILIGCSSGDLPSNSYYDDALLSRPYHSYFQGQIAEVIMFNKDVNGIDINLTTNQKEFLFCYLRDKWRSVKK